MSPSPLELTLNSVKKRSIRLTTTLATQLPQETLLTKCGLSENFSEEEKKRIKETIKRIEERARQQGKTLPNNLNLARKNEGAGIAAKDKDGNILIKDNFFNLLNDNDRNAVLYHEMCHVINDKPVSPDRHELEKEVTPPDIPYHIEAYLAEQIRQDFPDISDEKLEEEIRNEVTIFHIRDSSYYENELQAYQNEKELYPDDEISDYYKQVRDYAEWRYEQKLGIAQKNNY